MKIIKLLLLLVLLLPGCTGGGSDNSSKKTLTELQRDSVLSESSLPGADVVGRAVETSDSAAARAKRINELSE